MNQHPPSASASAPAPASQLPSSPSQPAALKAQVCGLGPDQKTLSTLSTGKSYLMQVPSGNQTE
eukprot:1708613-Rhodomonas_salina.1